MFPLKFESELLYLVKKKPIRSEDISKMLSDFSRGGIHRKPG